MSDIHYKRLTRSSWFATTGQSRSSLWAGADHLLSVGADNFRESYKRFYFRDIQAILVQKSDRFRTWNIILGMITVFMFVCLFASLPKGEGWTSDNIGIVSFFGVMVALLVVILALHLTRGQTCRTFLRTAVQIEELHSLTRMNAARRFLVDIHPLIVAAQGGELSPETIAMQMREWTAPAATATTAIAAPMATTSPADSGQVDPNVPPRLNP
jgi:hypothetical protein